LPQAQPSTASPAGLEGSGSPGYIFNGIYQPLACKIVEEIVKPSITKSTSLTDALKELQIPIRSGKSTLHSKKNV